MNSTAIECKLIRAGGTRATIESTEYHFQPYTDGAHVATVDNEEHADRFLSIREGYRLYRGEGKPVAAAMAEARAALKPEGVLAGAVAPIPEAPVALNICTNLFEPAYTIHGAVHTLADVAQAACNAAGLSTEAWNTLADIERSDAIEAELDRLDAAGPATTPEEVDRETLVAQYVALYGKKPHYTATVDKIRELIAAKQ